MISAHCAAVGTALRLTSAALMLLGAEAQAQAPHFPTNEDLRHTRAVSGPQLSPDGRLVLLSVTEPTVDGASTHLWLVDLDRNTSRQITFAPAGTKSSEGQGRWAPDGQSVFFTAHRGKHTQLFRLPLNGGEAQPLVVKVVPPVDASTEPGAVDGSQPKASPDAIEVNVSSYALSPDGRAVAIVARDPETPGEAKQKEDKADAQFVDHDQHGSRAYLVDLQTSQITPVGVAPNVADIIWSHRSDRLAILSTPMNRASDLGPDNKLWIVDPQHPGAPQQVMKAPPTTGDVVWSGGDTRLFLDAQSDDDAPPGYGEVYALTLADGSLRNLSKGFRGSMNGPALAEGDDTVIAAVTVGSEAGYARLDVASGRVTRIPIPGGVVGQLTTNERRTGWVYARAGTDEPAALYFATSLDAAGKRLATPASAGSDWRAVKASVVQWKNDGLTIEGLLYLPPGASSGRVPLVVDVHGGPTGGWLQSYAPFVQFLVGHGWAVLQPNPRGSTGYGVKFSAANKNDLGGGDYRDIMAGVDFVIAHFPIDSTKLGLYGYSYGGEMAGFVEVKTTRFKAIVSAAPVIDQFSEYGTEGGSWYDRWFFGKPWEHVEDAWRQSPLSGANRAKTPFLLLQGEDDTTDPLGQSLEMYRALRQAGAPVQLVTYPRDNHGPLSRNISGGPSPEPWHGFDARQRIAQLFQKAFGG